MSSVKPKHQRFHDFVSGLVAGLISVTVCNPLDIARTRLNVLVMIGISRMRPSIMRRAPSTPTSSTR